MKVIKPDNPQGFCYGVKRALEIVEAASSKGDVQILGWLVHNPSVVENLKNRGITTVDSISEATCNNLVITAHGAPKGVLDALSGKNIIDATCPFVVKFQKKVERLGQQGYQIVILGDKNHPEIKSVSSYTKDPIIISSTGDACKIDCFDKIALVCQTTQNIETLKSVSALLIEKSNCLLVENTICPSTRTRQKNASELAKNVALMVVVGGKNSANTKRLVEISQKQNTKTIWIECSDDLDETLLNEISSYVSSSQNKSIGLISGASTPIDSVERVFEKLISCP
ncbi:MAG: 4-hydroxy-3-methylbut-2-enyl diphosphate reductase [Caldisericia bacterium]